MAATMDRSGFEKILKMLREKATKNDLEWFRDKNPYRYERYLEMIDGKKSLADVANTEAIILGIQYLIDAITRVIGQEYHTSDIPKAYIPRLAGIVGISVPKKFKKNELIEKIIDMIQNN